VSGQRIRERRLCQQGLKPFSEISLQVPWAGPAFFQQYIPAIDNREQIAEIVAEQKVALAASIERLQLGGQKHRRRNQADRTSAGQCHRHRRFQRQRIPAIGKAEHFFQWRHDVDHY